MQVVDHDVEGPTRSGPQSLIFPCPVQFVVDELAGLPCSNEVALWGKGRSSHFVQVEEGRRRGGAEEADSRGGGGVEGCKRKANGSKMKDKQSVSEWNGKERRR